MRLYELNPIRKRNENAIAQLADFMVNLEPATNFAITERSEEGLLFKPLESEEQILQFIADICNGTKLRVLRSVFTCRGIDFGFDGQLYVMLSHCDLVTGLTREWNLHEMSQVLIETDHFDGFI